MQIHHFHLQNRRDRQQDHYWIDEQTGLFIVCDGVGGAARGEVASRLVCEVIAREVQGGFRLPDAVAVNELLRRVQKMLNERLRAHPDEEGMSTTLALARFEGNRVTVAHVGDSRVYVHTVRMGSTWRSRDHSLVQELFDAGLLKNESDMARHPMRNRLTRCLTARAEEPAPEAEVSFFELQPGDTVLLCSDGVLEPFTASGGFEGSVFAPDADLGIQMEVLRVLCAGESRDNATCVAVKY